MNLYDLASEFAEVVSQLDQYDLDPETLQDTLDSMKAPIETKIENMVKYMKSLEALADAKKLEAKRLSESAASDLKKAEFFKNYMADNLKRAGINKLQAGVFSLKFQAGREVVQVDESKLPSGESADGRDLYEVVPKSYKLKSKTELKQLLKEGVELPGVSLVRNPDSLVVK